MPPLSCCIIAKNEAHRLPVLLESLSGICEQIVLVDTGSTDNTIQIAENMGAEVSMFPWNDSFSDARNRSLEMAQHPWILYVDADDSVPEKSLYDISELKQRSPEKAYGFVITSTQDGVTGMASAQIRMFPNSKENRFQYRVHEQIRPALNKQGTPVVFTDIKIVHTGYTDSGTLAAKQRRNLELLEKDLADYPEDGFLRYLAGMACVDLEELTRARDEFKKAWGLSVANTDKGHIALGAALELSEMALREAGDRHANALLWLQRAESLEREYPRCLYLRGRIQYEKQEFTNALKSLRRLAEWERPAALFLPLDLTMLKTTAAALMGQIYLKTGRPQEAVSILNQAREFLRKS
jgi:glycosyltransferase involved in cell wall biosynthesis